MQKIATIIESATEKRCVSTSYNYFMNKQTGFFARWGKTQDENPEFSPVGPEIADIEITTKCDGVNGKVCQFCYKSNTPDGQNMSLDTFKAVFHKMCDAKVVIGLDNNENIEICPSTQVLLKNGNIVQADQLTLNDEIEKIL